MDAKEVVRALRDIFPTLSKEDAMTLAATGDDISVLVTRVLDNNIDAPTVSVYEITRKSPSTWKAEKPYNYPEIFEQNCKITDACVQNMRNLALERRSKAAEYGKQAAGHPEPRLRAHYSIQQEELWNEAEDLDRLSVIQMMRDSINTGRPIDLHGLYVKEAVGFLNDLYQFKKFTDITLITGKLRQSSKLRPAVTEWLSSHGFGILEEGPCIRGIKRKSK